MLCLAVYTIWHTTPGCALFLSEGRGVGLKRTVSLLCCRICEIIIWHRLLATRVCLQPMSCSSIINEKLLKSLNRDDLFGSLTAEALGSRVTPGESLAVARTSRASWSLRGQSRNVWPVGWRVYTTANGRVNEGNPIRQIKTFYERWWQLRDPPHTDGRHPVMAATRTVPHRPSEITVIEDCHMIVSWCLPWDEKQ